MRLVELFLNETTEEDRALISLAAAIYQHLQQYADQDLDYGTSDEDDLDQDFDVSVDSDDEKKFVGKIGDLFDTPIQGVEKISLEVQSDSGLADEINRGRKKEGKKPIPEAPAGLWRAGTNTIVINADYISTPYMKSVITHELRHALDDIKSEYKANQSTSYGTPRNKSYRNVTNDPHMGNLAYLAEPAEINGRFLQVLDDLVPIINRQKSKPTQDARNNLHKVLIYRMEKHNIAHLFPEKEKSRDYKRLLKRGADFIDKELAHAQSSQQK